MHPGERLSATIKKEFNGVKKLIAAYGAKDDEETLHDIRVSIRKVRSILSLATDFYELKIPKAIRKKLKEIFDKSSEVRDIDTFVLFLEKEHLNIEIKNLKEKKALLLVELKASLHTLANDPDINKALLFIAKELEIANKEGIEGFLKEDFNAIFFEYADVLRLENMDFEHLHEMRKRCKKSRYRLESVSKTEFKDRIALCKEFQERLGKINDFRVWLLQLEGLGEGYQKAIDDIEELKLQELEHFKGFIKSIRIN